MREFLALLSLLGGLAFAAFVILEIAEGRLTDPTPSLGRLVSFGAGVVLLIGGIVAGASYLFRPRD